MRTKKEIEEQIRLALVCRDKRPSDGGTLFWQRYVDGLRWALGVEP